MWSVYFSRSAVRCSLRANSGMWLAEFRLGAEDLHTTNTRNLEREYSLTEKQTPRK